MPHFDIHHLMMFFESDVWNNVSLCLSGVILIIMAISTLSMTFREFLYSPSVRHMEQRLTVLHAALLHDKTNAELLRYHTSSERCRQYLNSIRYFETITHLKEQHFRFIYRAGLLFGYGATFITGVCLLLGWVQHPSGFILLFLIPLSLPWLLAQFLLINYERRYKSALKEYNALTCLARHECEADISENLTQMKKFLRQSGSAAAR